VVADDPSVPVEPAPDAVDRARLGAPVPVVPDEPASTIPPTIAQRLAVPELSVHVQFWAVVADASNQPASARQRLLAVHVPSSAADPSIDRSPEDCRIEPRPNHNTGCDAAAPVEPEATVPDDDVDANDATADDRVGVVKSCENS
jgi:hypothetical protein